MNKYGLILLLAAALAACSSAEDRKTAYLQKAAGLQAQGNYEKARLEVKNALQIDPKDVQAWYLMGEMEEKLQNWRAAAGGYQRVLEMDAAHTGAKLKLGRLYLLGGAPERTATLVQEVLKAEPENVEALILRAGVAAKAGDFEAAGRDAHAALAKDPKNIDAAIFTATLEMRDGHADQAVRLLKQAIEQHPKHAGLRAVLADVYGQTGRIDEGAAQLREITGLYPEKVAPYVNLARYYLQHQNAGAAEQVLRDALKRQPKQQELQMALAGFLVDQRRQDEAVQTVEGFIKETPEDYFLRFRLAELHLAMGKKQQAESVYEAVIAAAGIKPDGLKARSQLARLAIAEGKTDRGAELLAQVLKENPKDNDALFLRAGLALQKQDAAAAIADLRAVLHDQPASVPALKNLARAHLLKGELDLALETLQKAVDGAPRDADVRIALADLLLRQGQKSKGREQVELVLKDSPRHVGALEMLFNLQIAEANYTQAMESAQRIQAEKPGLGDYYAGRVFQIQKKHDQAISNFEAALKQVPGAMEPLTALVQSRLALNQVALAEQRLRQELTRSGGKDENNFVVHNLLGEVLLLQKKTDAAIASLREAERLGPRFATPYRNLALAFMAKQDQAAAVEVLRRGITATDHDPALVIALATYEENHQRSEQAIALYQQALKARPREESFINNLAMMLAIYRTDKADIDRAVQLGESLKSRGNPAYLDTLGWAYYRRGDFTAAKEMLETAVRAAPDSQLLSYHLGMVYYREGDHTAARRYLERAVATETPYTGANEAKATLAKLQTS